MPIIRHWPVPVIPAFTCLLWLRYGLPGRAASALWFDVLPPLVLPFNMAQQAIDINAWLATWAPPVIPSGNAIHDIQSFFNDGVTTHSWHTTIGLLGTNPIHRWDPQLCPCFRKESVGFSPTRVGHMWFVPAPLNWTAGGRWSSAAIAAYQTFANGMLFGFASQGYTFLPTIYSPTTNSTYRMGSFRLTRRPSVRYSRRERLPYDRSPPIFPVVP